jgi:multicomponent Na+:H+ antiporter subunit E
LLHTLGLGFILAVLWLLLSGHFFSPLLLGLGAGSVILILYVTHRMDVIDREGHPIHLGFRAIGYWLWLLWEIVIANFQIARVILSPRMPIRPHLFDVRASQATELGHVIYANSITLTPGTVTVDVEDGILHVHALTQDSADGLLSGEMDRRVVEMEGLNAHADSEGASA